MARATVTLRAEVSVEMFANATTEEEFRNEVMNSCDDKLALLTNSEIVDIADLELDSEEEE